VSDARTGLAPGLEPAGRYAEWAPATPAYVVADVDGTMIASGTTATPVVAEAVAEAHAAGLRVGFATGRLPVGLRDLERQLDPAGPHIVHNGSEVVADGRPVRTWPLAPADAARLAEVCTAHGLYAEFFLREGFVVTDRREAARGTWEIISGEPDGLVAELDLAAVEVVKATVVAFAPDELPAIMAALEPLGLVAEAAPSPLFPGFGFVNVNGPGADKGTALRFAAGHLGVGLDAVVGGGDGLNDISMMAVAGTAVAMGQAPRAVRDAAHVVVPEVQADGVAHALRAAAAWRAASAATGRD
jgi:hypothetical protein